MPARQEKRILPAKSSPEPLPQKLPDQSQLSALFDSVQSGSREAEEAIFKANTGLVHRFANQYRGNGLGSEDLLQEGYISLIRAIRNFNPSLGIKFSTYACNAIRNDMVYAISGQSRLVRIPHDAYRDLMDIRRRVKELTGDDPNNPDPREVNRLTGVPLAKIKRLYNAARFTLSLNHARKTGDGEELSEFGELLPDYHSPDPPEQAARHNLTGDLNVLVDHLPPREAFIIRHRYGLNGLEPKTGRELGQVLGMSKSNVSILEKQALEKLRQLSDRVDLDSYLAA